MAPEETSPRKVWFDAYARSQANLRRLKTRMRRQHVEDLAGEVIQRLANRDDALGSLSASPSDDQLVRLCEALIASDDAAAARIVADLRDEHVPLRVVYLKHLAGAARLLGRWWEEDRVTFFQVTLGSARLLAILRSLRHLLTPDRPEHGKTALFASVPGETHVIGVTMAADLLRGEGWDIRLRTGLDHDALVSEIDAADCDLIGLSVAGTHGFEALSRLVVAVQICRPELPIVVGGPRLEDHRDMIRLLGVDHIVTDIEPAGKILADLLKTAQP